jgi:hypothetical protein
MDELGGGADLAERATHALSRFDQLQQQLDEIRKGLEARDKANDIGAEDQ